MNLWAVPVLVASLVGHSSYQGNRMPPARRIAKGKNLTTILRCSRNQSRDQDLKKIVFLAAEIYPFIHAKRLIIRLFGVIPAVQPSGIRIRFAQFLPYRVFVRATEVTETPGHENFGLG